MPRDQTLSPEQRKAIYALLSSGNVKAAAKAAGVSRDSIYRWMKEPAFKAELRAAEGLALEGLARSLLRLGDKAVAVLEAAMDDLAAPHSVKLKAASVVFTHHPQLLEAVTLSERVAELEMAQDRKPDGY